MVGRCRDEMLLSLPVRRVGVGEGKRREGWEKEEGGSKTGRS